MSSSATVTVLFCDVVGSTERLVRLGDIAADEDRRALFSALNDAVERNDGEVVKHLGDGLMVVFEHSAVRALSCARDLHMASRWIDTEDPISLRIGISAGEVAHEQSDWFGIPVVEAARLCNAAAPGQTLANAVVRHLVGSRAGDHRITEVGALPLKGLAAPLPTVDISWHDDPSHPVLAPMVAPVEPVATPEPPSDEASDLPTPSLDGDDTARPPRRRRRTTLAIAALLAVVLVGGGLAMAAGGGGSSGDASDGLETAPRLAAPRGYTPELRDAECAPEIVDAAPDAVCRELLVPESREDPDGDKVAVPVTSIYADHPSANPVVLVDVNEPVTTTSLSEVADVHALGLRGFQPGDRPELDCPGMRDAWEQTLRLRADDPEAIGRRVEAARQCAQDLRTEDVQLDGYNMAEVADDIRDLVIVDDLAPVNVAGGGLTTTAVASFARHSPDAVSAVLLTNPVSPGSSPLGDPVHSLEKSFERLVDLCNDDEECAAEHPDLTGEYRTKSEQYAAQPVLVAATTLAGTGPHQVLLDGRRWASALESAMFQSDRLGLMPEAIDGEGTSDELAASTAIEEEARFFIAPDARAGATLSYLCAYDAIPNRTAEISASAVDEFAGAADKSFAPVCEAWDVSSVFDQLSRPLTGDVPVLIAQGGISASGTNKWGEAMAAQLDHATLANFPTMSADLAYSPPPCLRKLRNEFIVDPAARHDVEACEKKSPPIEFVGR